MREQMEVHVHVHNDGGVPQDRLVAIEQALTDLKEQGARIMAALKLAQDALAAIDERTNEMATVIDEVVAADTAEDAAYDAKVAELTAQVAALQAGQALDAQTIADLNAGLEALASSGNNSAERLTALAGVLRGTGTTPAEPLPPVDVPAEVPGEIVPPVEEPVVDAPADPPVE